jgi:galactose mutarotase-like enzyme
LTSSQDESDSDSIFVFSSPAAGESSLFPRPLRCFWVKIAFKKHLPAAMQNLLISPRLHCLISLMFATCANAADMQVLYWGAAADGTKVEKTCVSNDAHMQVCYIDYGATITSITVPDRHGKMENIVLSLPDLPSYMKTRHRHAAIMGRYAGRIANAQFTLNGKLVQLIPNQRGLAVHGDPYGFDKRVWQRRDFVDDQSLGSVFHLLSPDGDQSMPGELDVSVTYRLLRASNEFRLEYGARSTAPTVINLTNHAYFNLSGAGSSGLTSHLFQIAADRYAETDDKRVPTGNLLPSKIRHWIFGNLQASICVLNMPQANWASHQAMIIAWCCPTGMGNWSGLPISPKVNLVAAWKCRRQNHPCNSSAAMVLTAVKSAAKANPTSVMTALPSKLSTYRTALIMRTFRRPC